MPSYSISTSKTPLLDLFRKKQRERELAERAKIPTVPCIQIHALVEARIREQQKRNQQKQQQAGAQAQVQPPQQQQQQQQQPPQQTSVGDFWSDPIPSTSREEAPAPPPNEPAPETLETQIKTEPLTESSQDSQTDSDAYTLRPRAFRPNYSDTRPRRASVEYVPANHHARPGLKKRVLIDLTNETDEDEDEDEDVDVDTCTNEPQIKKENESEKSQQATQIVDQPSQERRKSPRAAINNPPARYRDEDKEEEQSEAKRVQKELNRRRAAEKKKSWEQRKQKLAEQKRLRKKRLQEVNKKTKKARAAAKATSVATSASASVSKDAEATRSNGEEDLADEVAGPTSKESISIQTDPVVVWNEQTNGINLSRLLANIGNFSQVVIINCQTSNNTEQR